MIKPIWILKQPSYIALLKLRYLFINKSKCRNATVNTYGQNLRPFTWSYLCLKRDNELFCFNDFKFQDNFIIVMYMCVYIRSFDWLITFYLQQMDIQMKVVKIDIYL